MNPGASVYASSYALTKVEVDVKWGFITLNDIDVTNQVPAEQLSGSSTLVGPCSRDGPRQQRGRRDPLEQPIQDGGHDTLHVGKVRLT